MHVSNPLTGLKFKVATTEITQAVNDVNAKARYTLFSCN